MGILHDHLGRDFTGALLDVGSGYGFFLAEAKRQGWTVQGIESSPAEVEHSVRELSVSVLNLDVTEALDSLPGCSFDAVTFWHVLEHLEEPGKAILQARRLIRPGGVIILNSPNLDSAVFKLLGASWTWIYVPGHLQYFRATPLAEWLKRHMLNVKLLETWTHAPNLYFMLEESLLLRVASLLQWRTMPRKVAGRITRFVFGSYHQQVVQSRFRLLYRLTPLVDRYLLSRQLGHEFLIVASR
jgi:2-polyprenyl-3-methyl-5-hydroxy-6-metoxy-1,4-benzoquinol methylase